MCVREKTSERERENVELKKNKKVKKRQAKSQHLEELTEIMDNGYFLLQAFHIDEIRKSNKEKHTVLTRILTKKGTLRSTVFFLPIRIFDISRAHCVISLRV